jgi:arginyl-tRNA synthetase
MEERIRKALGSESAGAIRRPPDPAHGDYAVFVGKEAEAVAKTLKDVLGADAEHVEVAGPGFVNITLSREAVSFAVAEADAKGEEWGRGNDMAAPPTGGRVMIEYGNPNAFKEMHIGHMMGTIIGEAFSRLIESRGATVARDTFGGDVGPNVAKALWALQKDAVIDFDAKELGEAYAKGAKAYEEDASAKGEIDTLSKAVYAGKDVALMSLWERGREVSMQEFRRTWSLLGTKYDFELFDSDTTEAGMRIVQDGLAKGIFKKSDGAIIYDGEAKGVHTMVFITSHDTPTYEAKDLGLAFLREERWPSDRVIIVTGNEQAGRFKTVLAALHDVAPLLAQKTAHVAHGFMRLASGKMSSREGNVITASDFITDVIKKASEKNEDPLVAEEVAIGAIKYMILRQASGSDITFDPEKSLSLEGDSGPYLQYALVRAKSVLEKASKQARIETPPEVPYLIERDILHFPEIVARAAHELAPNLLTTYLTELAAEWNSFYAKEKIIGGEHEAHKLMLARAFVNTMQNGLKLLGIPTPEKM